MKFTFSIKDIIYLILIIFLGFMFFNEKTGVDELQQQNDSIEIVNSRLDSVKIELEKRVDNLLIDSLNKSDEELKEENEKLRRTIKDLETEKTQILSGSNLEKVLFLKKELN